MPQIATVEQLKAELELGSTTLHDELLELKLDIAEESVLQYVKQRLGSAEEIAAWSDEVDSWDETTAPRKVLGAILLMGCHLYKQRGDAHPDDTRETFPNELPRDVTALLSRLRDPTVV